jgi:hypothetical protein
MAWDTCFPMAQQGYSLMTQLRLYAILKTSIFFNIRYFEYIERKNNDR